MEAGVSGCLRLVYDPRDRGQVCGGHARGSSEGGTAGARWLEYQDVRGLHLWCTYVIDCSLMFHYIS